FDETTGILRKDNAWVKTSLGEIFPNSEGKVYHDRIISFGSTEYYMDSQGVKSTGLKSIGSDLYYFDETTGILRKDNAWVKTSLGEIFPNSEGKVYHDRIISFGSTEYYMDSQGKKATGLKNIGPDLYYFDETTGILRKDNAWVKTSLGEIFPNSEGKVYHDRIISFGSTEYYMDSRGVKSTGLKRIGSDLYYFDETTEILRKDNAWITVDGKDYFPNGEGKLYRGRIITFGSEEAYYMQHDGSKAANTFAEVENHLYYLRGDGRVAQDNAWITVDGKDYFPDKEGKLHRDRIITFGASAYYMNHAGQKSFGTIMGNGAQYFADRNTGLLYSDAKATDQDGQIYYLLPNYQMARGWRQIDRRLYYFDPEADFPAALRETKKNIYNVVYEFNSEGQVINNSAIEKAIARLDQTGWNLRLAFDWVASFQYKGLAQKDPSPGLDWFANIGFDTQSGNCFVYSATFYEMARLMNYDVRWMFGYVASHRNPHSWTEIILDGNTYVFDPDFTSEMERNGYQIQYGDKGTWRYVDYDRFS
ncbi:MAG: transglutaminase domain-containing protein, partial [Peptoniphilaceae bacterium]|nr:transglutaminase domain-containing protein [Peptoniphilaceae bacterium]